MITNMYACFDKKVEAFMQPFMARADGEAIRMFCSSFADSSRPSRIPAEDLELFLVGYWDDLIGEFGVPEGRKGTLPLRVFTGREAEAQTPKSSSPNAADVPWDTQTR